MVYHLHSRKGAVIDPFSCFRSVSKMDGKIELNSAFSWYKLRCLWFAVVWYRELRWAVNWLLRPCYRSQYSHIHSQRYNDIVLVYGFVFWEYVPYLMPLWNLPGCVPKIYWGVNIIQQSQPSEIKKDLIHRWALWTFCYI